MQRVFLIIVGFCLSVVPVGAETRQLDVSADYCTIMRSFGLAEATECPALGPAETVRSVAADVESARSAVPPGDPDAERGYFIRFAFDSDSLTQDYRAHLQRLARVFMTPQAQTMCFKLVGHTDAVGLASYNQKLSEQRARTVHLFLIGVAGVPAERVQFEGKGERSLLPQVGASHGLNRRVEILAKPQDGVSCAG